MTIKEMELDDDDLGVFALSIVDVPAIKENFIHLRDEPKRFELAKVDDEKRLLIGPALIPNKPIFRRDNEEDEGYYIYFKPSVIEKAAHNFIRKSMHLNHTLMHEEKLEGMSVVETWLIEDPERDKSTAYGFNLPKGTWMLSVHVDNEKVWNEQVKSGKVKGFSIEAYFSEKNAKPDPVKDAMRQLCDSIEKAAL